jgi:hypothetical protein
MPENELYLTVLPLMRTPPGVAFYSSFRAGTRGPAVEQIVTLFPDRNFATRFYPDEVELYINTFTASESYLTGGHAIGYEIFKEPTDDGRVIVRVVQHVG